MIQTNRAREVQGDMVIYDFKCEGCGSEGELQVPNEDLFDMNCPEACGARYIQWRPLDKNWELKCVVCPVFQ